MRRSLAAWVLVPALIVGSVLTWRSGRERARLEGQYARLVQLAGDAPVPDPSQVFIQAVPTGERLHFAWRVRTPPNYKQTVRNEFKAGGSSGSSSGMSSQPRDFLARVRVREDPPGRWTIFTSFEGSSGLSSFGDPALIGLLRGRWDEIRVEQLGAGEGAAVAPDRRVVLLRLRLPDALKAEAEAVVPAYLKDRLDPLYELTLGEDPPPEAEGGGETP